MNFGNAKTEVLKEPRGFIKIIQFFFSILAFACLVDWRGHLSFQVTCPNGTIATVEKTFQYPFAMDAVEVDVPLCKGSKTPPAKKDFELNAVSPSQFFVFIGVMSFFASIIICAVYVLYEVNILHSKLETCHVFDKVLLCMLAVWFSSLHKSPFRLFRQTRNKSVSIHAKRNHTKLTHICTHAH